MPAYTSHTLNDLLTRLEARWDGVPFWSRADAINALQDTCHWWQLLTGMWATSTAVDLTAGNYDYPLPLPISYTTRVATAAGPLYPSSLWDLDHGRPGWRDETVDTGGDVPTRPVLWAPVSINWIVLWPTPTSTVLAGLLLEGVGVAPPLSQESDTVDLSEDLLGTFLDAALHLAAFDEGGQRFAATLPKWDAFVRAAGEENQQLKASKFYRRYFGLDSRRLFKPTQGGANQLTALAGSE